MRKREIEMRYDPERRRAVIHFANGGSLALDNVSREKAEEFTRKHAPEFEARDERFRAGGGAPFTRAIA